MKIYPTLKERKAGEPHSVLMFRRIFDNGGSGATCVLIPTEIDSEVLRSRINAAISDLEEAAAPRLEYDPETKITTSIFEQSPAKKTQRV